MCSLQFLSMLSFPFLVVSIEWTLPFCLSVGQGSSHSFGVSVILSLLFYRLSQLIWQLAGRSGKTRGGVGESLSKREMCHDFLFSSQMMRGILLGKMMHWDVHFYLEDDLETWRRTARTTGESGEEWKDKRKSPMKQNTREEKGEVAFMADYRGGRLKFSSVPFPRLL